MLASGKEREREREREEEVRETRRQWNFVVGRALLPDSDINVNKIEILVLTDG
jgi:hypothetical protein